MSLFVLSQILVGIAICTDIASFQFKERVHIVSCLLISCIMIAIHFWCLGHWTAACLALLAAIRFIACLFSTSRKLLWVFLMIAIVVSAFTYEGLLTILGFTGTIFGTFAAFSKDDKILRQFMFVGTSIWIVHNVIAGSPGAVLLEIIFLSSNVIGYFRYYIKPRKQVLNS
ncbi:YgjV family protein [Desulfosediminicola flagellatus]|uniref:YgjV family protein n=1 Tax=Desulfosediminicola flagellatus TaxID=2569541 RepID=UPI0010ACE577|nr:YgjV family protein [Desulfosediminicola flagellatus]